MSNKDNWDRNRLYK